MFFKNWFKCLFNKNPPKRLLPSYDTVDITQIAPNETVGLNFISAIEAHQNWKKRLTSVVDGSSVETLKVDIVSRDDQCLLGKWIYSTGAENFSSLEQFDQLKKNHAHFHCCAGNILHLAQTQDKSKALAELKDGSHYTQASQQVIRDLVAVYTKVNNNHAFSKN
jgi:Chemoreceptor zinc-binding domain